MSNADMFQNTQPIVHIEELENGVHGSRYCALVNGGSVEAFGMGLPYAEPIGEGKFRPVDSGFVASIFAAPLQSHSGGSVEQTNHLEFITPQGVHGAGLALMALCRHLELSSKAGTADTKAPLAASVSDLLESVIMIDPETRLKSQANSTYTPGHDATLQIIPPRIASDPYDTVDVHLYVDPDNNLDIKKTPQSVEVGVINFEARLTQDTTPIDELFRRTDWRVTAAPYTGYSLNILTSSRLRDVTQSREVAVAKNVTDFYGKDM